MRALVGLYLKALDSPAFFGMAHNAIAAQSELRTFVEVNPAAAQETTLGRKNLEAVPVSSNYVPRFPALLNEGYIRLPLQDVEMCHFLLEAIGFGEVRERERAARFGCDAALQVCSNCGFAVVGL